MGTEQPTKAGAARAHLTRDPTLGEATRPNHAVARTGVVITKREASRAALLRAMPTVLAALLGGAAAQAVIGPGGVLPTVITAAAGLALAVAVERGAKARVRIGPGS